MIFNDITVLATCTLLLATCECGTGIARSLLLRHPDCRDRGDYLRRPWPTSDDRPPRWRIRNVQLACLSSQAVPLETATHTGQSARYLVR